MKKILIILLVLMSSSMLFAETLSKSAVITARKRGNVNGSHIPDAEAQIRLSDGQAADFGQDANVQIPATARTESYTAFTWYYSGNLYDGVTISFQFEPMRLLDEESSLSGTMTYVENTVIPYTVYFDYITTRIGNGTTNINKEPTNLRHKIDYWDNNTYYIRYADAVSLTLNSNSVSGLSSSASITRSNAVFAVTANMSTNSLIYDAETGGNAVAKATFLNKFKDNSGNSLTAVADYWVRSGSVRVDIDIDANGKNWTVNDTNGQKPAVTGGVYYANVTIGFTKD